MFRASGSLPDRRAHKVTASAKKMNDRTGATKILGSCSCPVNLTERGIVMCKFCENKKRIEFDDGKETWNIQNTEKGYEMIYANHETGRLKSITISNCPICGRKLMVEEDEEEKYLREKVDFDELLERYTGINRSLKDACAKITGLKKELDIFNNYLLPRATIQAGEEIKKGNYSSVTIVTNGERCEGKELLEKISKLNDRHQSNCIKINQLQTTIDVLVDKLAKLREVHGL